MLVYKCLDLTNSTAANASGPCRSIHEEAQACLGNLLIAGWAVGAGVRNYFVHIYNYSMGIFIRTSIRMYVYLYTTCVICFLHCLFIFKKFVYPENVAYPIGGERNDTYLLIQMHYDNPRMETGGYLIYVRIYSNSDLYSR